MALQDQKITSSDLANKGVVGLPDTPNLSTLVMQQKFDEIATAVIVPKFNALIDYLIESLAPIVSDNPQDGEVLIYFADSSQYKNGVYRTTLADLKDVNVGGVQNKMFLCYDEDRDLWYPEASSGVMETISACKDVSIVNPQTGDIFKFDGTAWANVPDERGLLIVFNIDSEDGATITALTPSGNTVTATSLGGGQYVIKSDEYGEWHLTGEKNGETVTTTIDVSVSQIYDVTMNFFAATITVTYPADATVTCSKDSEEYTATGSPYTFTVHGSGDWVIEGTRSGITETQTVTITTNGQSESVTLTILPDGSTVTPTDSIPTLLHCADIWDKSYTSIGEVLDDSDSLFKILTTDNSIDYLVRSTTYASSVTTDSDAMSMIGSYDYCADTLIANATWKTAIDGSAYKSSVYNAPNNTRVAGGVQNWLRSGGITDKTYTTLAEVLADTTTLSTLIANHDAVDYLVTAKGLIDGIVADATAMSYIGLNNYCANTLLGDEVWLTAIANSSYVDTVLNVKVPTMTSATAPSGQVICGSQNTSYPAWQAFGNASARWVANQTASAGGTKSDWIGYVFTESKVIKSISISLMSNLPITAYTIKASNDGVTYTDIKSGTSLSGADSVTFLNDTAYKYWRFDCTQKNNTGGNAGLPQIYELQFYGRDDV